MRKNIVGQALAVCLALGLFTMEAPAQVFRIAPQQSAKIDKHGVCRVVKNTNGTAAMVPAKSAAEWASGQSSFLAREREGLIVSACECSPLGRTYGDAQYINNLYKPVISASGDDIAGIYEVNGSARLQFYSKSGSNYVSGSSFGLATKPYGEVISMAFSGDSTKLQVLLSGRRTRTYVKNGGSWSLDKSGSVSSPTLALNSAYSGFLATTRDGATIVVHGNDRSNGVSFVVLEARPNGDWVETQAIKKKDIPGADWLIGTASDFELSDDGSKLLIEYAEGKYASQAEKAGAALFELEGGTWKLTKNIKTPSSAYGNYGSYFLTANGNRIIASMPGSFIGKGYLHSYEKRNGLWTRVYSATYPKTSGFSDMSGIVIWEVNADGSIFLEGRPGFDDPWNRRSSRRFHHFDGTKTKLLKPGTLDPGGEKWLQEFLVATHSGAPRLSASGEVTIFKTRGSYKTVNGESNRPNGPTVVLGMKSCAD